MSTQQLLSDPNLSRATSVSQSSELSCKPTDAEVIAPDVPDPVAIPPRKATEEVLEAAPDVAALDTDIRSAVEPILLIPKTLHVSSPGPTEALLPTAAGASPSLAPGAVPQLPPQRTLDAISLMLGLAENGDGSQALDFLAGLTGVGDNETRNAKTLIDRLKHMQASILDAQELSRGSLSI